MRGASIAGASRPCATTTYLRRPLAGGRLIVVARGGRTRWVGAPRSTYEAALDGGRLFHMAPSNSGRGYEIAVTGLT